MNIGHEIKYRRRAKGLTQRQLAKLTGHNQDYISNLENGKKSPSITTLAPFMAALGGTLTIVWE